MAFLSKYFSFFGRVGRKDYAISLGIVVLLGFVIAVLVGNLTDDVTLVLLGLFVIAFLVMLVSWAAHYIRRVRDMGFHSLFAWLSLAGIFVLPIVFDGWGTLFMVLGAMVIAAFLKSWDDQLGLTHILAILRRIALADGKITQAEVGLFNEMAATNFNFPPNIQKLAQRDFLHGHQDTVSVAAHAQAFKQGFGKNSELQSGFSSMMWAMANANGPTSPQKTAIIKEVSGILNLSTGLPDHLVNIIKLLAKMAKADGVVQKVEIETVSDFFKFGLELSPDMRREAINQFQNAKNDTKPFTFYADRCIADIKAMQQGAAPMKDMFFALLMDLAMADGEVHPSESEILEYVAERLGITGASGYGNTGGQQQEKPRQSAGAKNAAHYAKVLQVDPDADAATIKKAYREMVQTNHPDKVSHMSKSIQDFANEQMLLAQEAYDFFKSSGRA